LNVSILIRIWSQGKLNGFYDDLPSMRHCLLSIRPPDLTIRAPWEMHHTDEELLEFSRYRPEFKDAIVPPPNHMPYAEYFEKLPLLLADFHLKEEWMLVSMHWAIMNWLYPEIAPLLPGAVVRTDPNKKHEPPRDFTLSIPGLDLVRKPAIGCLSVDMDWNHQESEVRLFFNRVISAAFSHIHEATENAQFANIAPLDGKPDTIDTNLKHLALRVVKEWSASTIIERDLKLAPRDNKNKASDIYSATKKLSKVLEIAIPDAAVTISKSR
ncbi:MAG: hypothetical protein JXX29_15025, partial [Deltaproteobacteria bacterium]|nr:hypothetical protein [Deltaproteobacteria bacterium]